MPAQNGQAGRKVKATLKHNREGRRPAYNVDDQGIVGTLYLEPNEAEEAREVPEEFSFTMPQVAVNA